MELLKAILLCAVLVPTVIIVHYEGLQQIARRTDRPGWPTRLRLYFIVLAATMLHLVDILIYGTGYYLGTLLEIGQLIGRGDAEPLTYFYFSAETYTSLGFGDLYPAGSLRLIAGIECLNGLVLIGWSTAFIYLSMRRFWAQGPSGVVRPARALSLSAD
jgi:hypothetical protein